MTMSGEQSEPARWLLTGASVPGAKRKDASRNEDAFDCWHVSDQIVVACVADGHGQYEHARSDVGARLATRACRACLSDESAEWFQEPLTVESLATLRYKLVETWRHDVALDLLANPLSRREFPTEMPQRDFLKLLLDPTRVYGSTLTVVLITPSVIAELSIGDAEVLLVDENEACFSPGERHEQLGDETTSLCLADAAHHFRVHVRSSGEVRLAVLCTDGVTNAFCSREDFERLALDLDAMAPGPGEEDDFESELSGWLSDYSRMASGDDATLVMLSRERSADKPQKSANGRPVSTPVSTRDVTRPIDPGAFLERGIRQIQRILDPGREK